MSITNGSTILEADLDAMITAQLQAISNDNQQVPGGLEVGFVFYNPTAAISAANPERFKSVFVVPYDCYLEAFALEVAQMTNPSTVTATLSAIGTGAAGEVVQDPLSIWPLSVQNVVTATGPLTRLFFDNTKVSPKAFASTSRVHRTLLEGSTLQVQLTVTGNAVAASMARLTLVLREFFARE